MDPATAVTTNASGVAAANSWTLGSAVKTDTLRATATGLTDQQKTAVADYAEGLVHWRAGEFDSAAACFERSASADRPASIFLERARQLAANPPGVEWDSIRTLESK